MKNEAWPEFVTDTEDAAARRHAQWNLTGWEMVKFELDDQDIEELLSAFSTAAIAP
jgi:hypothetical protein